MTDSVDGKYIFIGLPCGLVALDALAQNFLGSWEEEGAEVTYIQSYQIGPELYLINTIDDMGKDYYTVLYFYFSIKHTYQCL